MVYKPSFLFIGFKDVAWKIAQTAQQNTGRGIIIMSATGMLKEVTLINPAHGISPIKQEVCHTHSISRCILCVLVCVCVCVLHLGLRMKSNMWISIS